MLVAANLYYSWLYATVYYGKIIKTITQLEISDAYLGVSLKIIEHLENRIGQCRHNVYFAKIKLTYILLVLYQYPRHFTIKKIAGIINNYNINDNDVEIEELSPKDIFNF